MERVEHDYEREKAPFMPLFGFILAVLITLLLLFIGWVKYSGTLRWTVSIFALAIIATLLTKRLYSDSIPLKSWKRESELDVVVGSKLKDTSDTVQRALGGYDTSQALLEERITRAFMDKLKRERDISPDSIDELLKDPERLERVIQDRVITKFLITSRDYRDTGTPGLFSESSSREKIDNYDEWIKKVLKHMEEWS